MGVQNNRSHLNTGKVTWDCQWKMSLRQEGEKRGSKTSGNSVCLHIDQEVFNMI